MPQTITCLRCQHESEADAPLSSGVFRCDECGARMAYGELAPRVVVEPDGTGRFVLVRALSGDDVVVVKLDAQLAASVAINILSLVKP